MPIRPDIKVLTNTSADVLNVIRNNASINYQNYVPIATPNAESIKEIGAIIMDYPALQNEFLSALINRIGRVIVTSKSYDNPLAIFKRGIMEFGETIEEVFVAIANPQQYDLDVAEQEVFKREIPDVRSAFHIMNYQKFYKVTIQNEQLRQAFLSVEGITDLIGRITEQLYTAANYDEFMTMKYMLAKEILNGHIGYTTVAGVSTEEQCKKTVSAIKTISNNMTFMSSNYNVAGVKTHTPKERQTVLISSQFDAILDTEVLAYAFNMSLADFNTRKILVDSFGDLDYDRLDALFVDDTTYRRFTEAEINLLNSVGCVILDDGYFMVLDNLLKFTEVYKGQGMYWNYFYHCWKTFSISPFAQAVAGTTTPINRPNTATPDNLTVVFNGINDEGETTSISSVLSAVDDNNLNLLNGYTYTIAVKSPTNNIPTNINEFEVNIDSIVAVSAGDKAFKIIQDTDTTGDSTPIGTIKINVNNTDYTYTFTVGI
jgi:hypothetical protein